MNVFLIITLAATLNFCSSQQDTDAVKRLTPTEYKAQKATSKEPVLLDVRTPEEFTEAHVKGAKNSDYRGGTFAEDMKSWDKKKTYYLYCATGNRSGKAAQMLQEAGFERVYNIGGFTALEEAGLPTVSPKQK
ncbi:rhodanese-like domain-containing protein [Pontibacter silvestris]|uniref:Rhodanese-like domain-containing protein n=1 Tax=Pontibacter silvestris TaxID=2305183 RepID=A0ABW4X051_9BACT|nr:rhodanese-like domain-containing protein [Pontibacter silvestris]MCC9135436.1 rhodanese-like domain-containing protein [Pontibacter silvestris]